jgi:hypothetical protein
MVDSIAPWASALMGTSESSELISLCFRAAPPVVAELAQQGRQRSASRIELIAREHLMIAKQPFDEIAAAYIRKGRPVVQTFRPLHL